MKEYWNIQFGYRGAEVYYVPVDKQTMHFWKYQWNSYLERYAFDQDPFGRQEVREYLKNHLRKGEVFDEKTDFASDWENMSIGADVYAWGAPNFMIGKGTMIEDEGHKSFTVEKEIFCLEYELFSEGGNFCKVNGVDWSKFWEKCVEANTTDYDVEQFKDDDGNYFVIELYRDQIGGFGDYFIEVDEGTFDPMKLKLNRTRMLNGEPYINSVFYDGKEIEIDTDACGGEEGGLYHNFHSNVEGYGNDSSKTAEIHDYDDFDGDWEDEGEWRRYKNK